MKNYNYGHCTIEVSEEWFDILQEMDRQERCNNKKETRRHISLDYLNSKGIDFSNGNGDMLLSLIKKEAETNLHIAISQLSHKQQELIQMFFFEEKTITQIAKIKGLNKSSISRQLVTIYEKIKKLL